MRSTALVSLHASMRTFSLSALALLYGSPCAHKHVLFVALPTLSTELLQPRFDLPHASTGGYQTSEFCRTPVSASPIPPAR